MSWLQAHLCAYVYKGKKVKVKAKANIKIMVDDVQCAQSNEKMQIKKKLASTNRQYAMHLFRVSLFIFYFLFLKRYKSQLEINISFIVFFVNYRK